MSNETVWVVIDNDVSFGTFTTIYSNEDAALDHLKQGRRDYLEREGVDPDDESALNDHPEIMDDSEYTFYMTNVGNITIEETRVHDSF
jgi:hypothetical protein